MTLSTNPVIRLPETLRLLHLGDSYTCAEGIATEEGWPEHCRQELQAIGFTVEAQEILAKNGWSSGELLEAVTLRSFRPEWDFITLCVGANDQYRKRSLDKYTTDLEALLQAAFGLCRSGPQGVLLLSIPDWGASPFAQTKFPQDCPRLSEETGKFNESANTMAQDYRIPFLDWTLVSRDFENHPDGFTTDALHPSPLQQKAMADFIFQNLEFAVDTNAPE
jgi:lysophospholipase L1-like esterase